MRTAMLVATHKEAEVPEGAGYLPVHVGHASSRLELGHQPDDTGDHISERNPSWCELTALYWAWRNLDADVVGLSHYRRYFRGSRPGPAGTRILSEPELTALLAGHDVVLARRRHYVVETVESHFRHAHHGGDLDVVRAVLAEWSPALLPAYERVLGARSLSLYNMFAMRRPELDRYAGWLFPLLDEVEERIDATGRTAYQARTIGYLGERLLNVWVAAHPDLRVVRRPVVHTEGEPVLRKGVDLLRRKSGLIDAARRTS